MKLNLANKFTILRVLMLPVFVAVLLIGKIPYNYAIALILFILASITDWLDGYIARKYNMVTDLGKFLDPLADKMLVISALICFVELAWIPSWVVVIIVMREFMVSGFRLSVCAKDNKAVIAADIWGKIKTAFTMSVIIYMLAIEVIFELYHDFIHPKFSSFMAHALGFFDIFTVLLVYMVVAITVFSGFTIIWKNRRLFGE
ncbi:MAG: CDP-diacylglycerol--glycerol-3-phosphate 3-phosphatidyltransferase [Oscillospiraceae bacterium]|nr:CDP-diacylglycerol--glycerol-3-phosphate 3-phosphatidyltransferase [Oscillospiraceae bacterium]